MDATDFISSLPPKMPNEIRLFHLGNFLSVLNIPDAEKFLKTLSSKMCEGDLISIFNINSNQFINLKEYTKGISRNGMYTYSKQDRFFRTVLSEDGSLINSLKLLKLDCEKGNSFAAKLDEGPLGREFHFTSILGRKGKKP
jgi:hypothetical protein